MSCASSSPANVIVLLAEPASLPSMPRRHRAALLLQRRSHAPHIQIHSAMHLPAKIQHTSDAFAMMYSQHSCSHMLLHTHNVLIFCMHLKTMHGSNAVCVLLFHYNILTTEHRKTSLCACAVHEHKHKRFYLIHRIECIPRIECSSAALRSLR